MADWEIPSSRESVDASSAWNQWLRDEVPAMLFTAAEAFVKRAWAITAETHAADGTPTPAAALCDEAVQLLSTFLQCVPTREQATEFFAPLAPSCSSILRTCRVLPTCDGRLASPEEVVIWRELEHDQASGATGELLRHVGLVPLHPQLHMPDALADGLGVRRLDARLLCELLTALISRNEMPDHDWLAWVFEQLQRDANLSTLLPTLRTLPLIPLSGGGWSCVARGPIYEIDDRALSSRPGGPGLLQSIPSLQLAHPAFLRAVHERRDARCLLARLKVTKLSASELVMHHAVPALAAVTTPSAALPGLLAFARCESLSSVKLADELPGALLSSGAQLLGADGARFTLQRVAGVPMALSEHGAALQLCSALCKPDEDLLPADGLPGWPTVSDEYLRYHLLVAGDETSDDGDTPSGDLAGWRDFFLALGVDSFPAAVPVFPSADRAASVGSAPVCDWESPALEALLSELVRQANVPSLEKLLSVVLERWPALQACGALPDASQSTEHAETRLLQTLRGHAWLAASDDGTLRRPSELWLPTDEITSVLLGAVPYTRVELPAPIAMLLGVQTTLNPPRVLQLLADWAAAAEAQASHHLADPADFASLYMWLGAHAAADAGVRQQLLGSRSIWAPRRCSPSAASPPPDSTALPGDFYLPAACVWKDETDLLGDAVGSEAGDVHESAVPQLTSHVSLQVLGRSYPSAVQDAFAQIGVPEQPPLEVYMSILHAAPHVGGGRRPEILAATLRVYALLGAWTKAASAASAAGTAPAHDHGHGLLDEMRAAVNAHGMQLPVATGEWVQGEEVYFFARDADATEWGESTLAHAVIVPDVSDESFEDDIRAFLSAIVGLSPLAACVKESIDMESMPPVEQMEHASRSSRMVAIAGVLQRLTAGPADVSYGTEQREALHRLLCGLRFHVAEPLRCYKQTCVPSVRDFVLERKLLDAPHQAYLWLNDAPSDVAAPVVGRSAAQPSAVLFMTSQAQPRDLIVQLSKLLPPGLQAKASLSLFPVLHQVWGDDAPTPALATLLLGDQHGLDDLPPLPGGETLWLVGEFRWDASIAAALVEAQQRERDLMLSGETTAVSPLSDQPAEEGGLDPVLLKAIHGREAARAAARARGQQPPRNVLVADARGAPALPEDGRRTNKRSRGSEQAWDRLPPFPAPPPLPQRPSTRQRRASQPPESAPVQQLSGDGAATQNRSLEGATEQLTTAGDHVGTLKERELEVIGAVSPEILALPGLNEIDRGRAVANPCTPASRSAPAAHFDSCCVCTRASRPCGPLGREGVLRASATALQ